MNTPTTTKTALPDRTCAVSWSGGKDCYHALQMTRQQLALHGQAGKTTLISMLDATLGLTSAHGLSQETLTAQANCLGLPIVFGSAIRGEYEQVLKKRLAELPPDCEPQQLILGDIDLQAHRSWYESIFLDSRTKPYFPLWGISRKQLLAELFDAGVEAVIVSIKNDSLPIELLGQTLTADVAEKIRSRGVCPSGEEGDFHTLVTNGPGFTRRLALTFDDIWHDGRGHSLLRVTAQ